MVARWFCVAACGLHLVQACGGPKLIRTSDATHLVREALPQQAKRLPGLSIASGPLERGRCITFEVLWDNPGIGSAHVNFYTVDLRTAVLWSGVVGTLRLVVTPAVTRMQRDLRRSLGISDKEYRQSVQEMPCGY